MDGEENLLRAFWLLMATAWAFFPFALAAGHPNMIPAWPNTTSISAWWVLCIIAVLFMGQMGCAAAILISSERCWLRYVVLAVSLQAAWIGVVVLALMR